MIYSTRIQKAIKFSIKTHEIYQQQKRKGKNIPYVVHPLSVSLILAKAGASEDVIIAGILHDTIEDSVPEKKVTKEMLTERFGEKVAALVESITEKRKDLPWEERKAEALKHVQTFSHDSLLLKSADVVNNESELITDYKKEGEVTFSRFNAPKEKLIKYKLLLISAIVQKWKDNPLKEDLLDISRELQSMTTWSNIVKNPAKIIEYEDYDENMPLVCPICHWSGTPKESGWIEYYDDLLDVSCPICEKMLLVVNYPLINHQNIVKDKYFVEECDIYSSHIDHEIIEWFGDLDKAKRFADKKALSAMNYIIYRVYNPNKNDDGFSINSNRVYEAKGRR